MKITIIRPGEMSIPRRGWGAVESLMYEYYQECFFGGGSVNFKKLILKLSSMVDFYLVRGKIPFWHDESYLNHYLSTVDVKVLPASYAYPERIKFNFKSIVLNKNKPHNEVRSINSNLLPRAAQIIDGLSFDKKENLYRNLYLKAHEKNQRLDGELQKLQLFVNFCEKYRTCIYKFVDTSFYKQQLKKIYKKVKKVLNG